MKVGRNDPCPCGSGKKFKKCCEKKTGIERHTFSDLGTENRSSSLGKISTIVAKSMKEESPKQTSSLNQIISKPAEEEEKPS